jgi:hypothetical protein
MCISLKEPLLMDNNNKHHHDTAKCWSCNEIMNTRAKRNILFRTILFWLPVKAYFCAKCATKRHVIQRSSHYHEIA